MKYGYIKSELDGSEHIFKPSKSIELPSEYSYMKYWKHSFLSINNTSKPTITNRIKAKIFNIVIFKV